jgi:hypothetical protein
MFSVITPLLSHVTQSQTEHKRYIVGQRSPKQLNFSEKILHKLTQVLNLIDKFHEFDHIQIV